MACRLVGAKPVCVKSLRPGDAYMFHWTGHQWFSPLWCQAITWTNTDKFSIGPLGYFTQKSNVFIKKNAFENVCKMLSILSRPQCDRMRQNIWVPLFDLFGANMKFKALFATKKLTHSDRSLPRLTGALLRAWLRLRHGAFWWCAPAPLTKLDLIDWLIGLVMPYGDKSSESTTCISQVPMSIW